MALGRLLNGSWTALGRPLDGPWMFLGQHKWLLDGYYLKCIPLDLLEVLRIHTEVYSSILFGGLDRLPIIKSTLSMRETFESAAAAKF